MFVVNALGVHLVGQAEYTLCGDALEGDPPNGLEETWKSHMRTVTCPRCIEVIKLCRGVHISHD